MSIYLTVAIIVAVVGAATPILIAALGELVVEKSGVLNLGVEGMMLIGAVWGFLATVHTGSSLAGLLAAAIGGILAAMIFAFLTLTLASNQVATGLALTIFGTSASALIGEHHVGMTVERIGPLFPAILAEDPFWRVIFGYNPLVYLSLGMVVLVAWFLRRSRAGLIVRAVGENAEAAHQLGYRVHAVRFAATAFGGAMAGIGGGYYSLVVTPMWAEELTAGRGWIALALVVFATWRPWRLLGGAYLFGIVMTLELHAKAAGFSPFPSEFLAAMPYIATILVLALLSFGKSTGLNAPGSLGRAFRPTT